MGYKGISESRYPLVYTKGILRDITITGNVVTIYTIDGSVYRYKFRIISIGKERIFSRSTETLYKTFLIMMGLLLVTVMLSLVNIPLITRLASMLTPVLAVLFIVMLIMLSIAYHKKYHILCIRDDEGVNHYFQIPGALVSHVRAIIGGDCIVRRE
ncbi:MAG: hypothetical protein DRO40_01670 [Thermoprotei archaeon]|nr:MAG: hypothetical protein DRO40_01670 [Thermoprotei archaeon]